MSAHVFMRYLKAVVIAVTAALYLSLVPDWCVPGAGLHEAVKALGFAPGTAHPPLWAFLVRRVGLDVAGLSTLSIGAALLCVTVILIFAEDILIYAVFQARKHLTRTEVSFSGVKIAAMCLTASAFVLTPGFLRAATRVGPLMSLLLPPLVALVMVQRVLLSRSSQESVFEHLRRHWFKLMTAFAIFGYVAWQAAFVRRLLIGEWRTFLCFFLIGLFPLLAFADLTRRQFLLGRKGRLWFFGVWTFLILVTGVGAIRSLGSGHVAERVVKLIIRQASGCRGVVSSGVLDDLFVFLLPKEQRLVSYARNLDPAYGRALSDWTRQQGYATDSDLVFAAELGPLAFVSEWRNSQNLVDVAPTGLSLLTPDTYFPTAESWRAATYVIRDMRGDEPLGVYLRHLLGACGNHLACSLLEKGDQEAAWKMFWEVLDRVDSANYTVLVNMSGMVERGYASSKKDQERLKFLRDVAERGLATVDRRRLAAVGGGRLYVDPKVQEQYEVARQKALANDEISPEARAFIKTVSAAPKSEGSARLAREEIRRGVNKGLVRLDRIGDQLLTIDCMLEDWESAEQDSLSVLRLERRHVMANSTMGMLAGTRGDYLRAERFLRRAMRSSAWNEAGTTLNDLAFTLVRLGKKEEAEGLARRAVKTRPADWNFRETLALALICGGKPDEGERELAQAETLAAGEGRNPNAVARFALDRAWLCKVRGDDERLRIALRVLQDRQDLTAPQRGELEELRK